MSRKLLGVVFILLLALLASSALGFAAQAADVAVVQVAPQVVGPRWNCSQYNFTVDEIGRVFVQNLSGSNEPGQTADVYINNVLVANNVSVPAKSAGTDWTLITTVPVPNTGTWTWKVHGDSDCEDTGSRTTTLQLNLSHIECAQNQVEIHFVLLNVPDGVTPGTLTYTYGTINPGAHTGNVWHYTDYKPDGTYNITSATVVVGGVTVQLHNPGAYAGDYNCAPIVPTLTVTGDSVCHANGTWDAFATATSSTHASLTWSETSATVWNPSGSQATSASFSSSVMGIPNATANVSIGGTFFWSNEYTQNGSLTVSKPENCVVPPTPVASIASSTVCHTNGTWDVNFTLSSSVNGYNWEETSGTEWDPDGVTQADSAVFVIGFANIPNATGSQSVSASVAWNDPFSTTQNLSSTATKPQDCVTPPTPSASMAASAVCEIDGTWTATFTISSTDLSYKYQTTSGSGWNPSGLQEDEVDFTKVVANIPNGTAQLMEVSSVQWNDPFETAQVVSAIADRPEDCEVPAVPVASISVQTACVNENGSFNVTSTLSSSVNGYQWEETSAEIWNPDGVTQPDSAVFSQVVNVPLGTDVLVVNASVSWDDPAETTQNLSKTANRPEACDGPTQTPDPTITPQVTPTDPPGEPFRGCRLVLDPAFINHVGDPVRFYDRTDGHVAVDWIDAIKVFNGQVVLEFPFANMVGGEYLVEYGNPPKGSFVARGCVQAQPTPRPIPASGSNELPQDNNTPWGLVVLAFLVILSALAFKARTK